MARFPDDLKEQIRQSISLPQVLMEDGQTLHREGRSYRGRCPFEPGSKSKNKFEVKATSYKCHDCGQKGDIFTWLQKQRGLPFREAMQAAASLAGIGVDHLMKPEREAPPEDPAKVARHAALAALADLARETAEALPPDERVIDGIPVDALVAGGEVGRLPTAERILSRLAALGVGPHVLEETGVARAAAALGGQWVVWSRQRDRVYAGRPFGRPGPVVSAVGPRPKGWIASDKARMRLQADMEAFPYIATDDHSYLVLRASGVDAAFRPITRESLELAEKLPRATDRRHPPLLVLRPSPNARKRALQAALALLPLNPRVRAVELDPLPVTLRDREAWSQSLDRVTARAGTAFDWQVHLLAAHGQLDEEEGRMEAGARLAQVVRAAAPGPEQVAYAIETEHLTGLQVDVAPPRVAGDSVSRARTSTLNA